MIISRSSARGIARRALEDIARSNRNTTAALRAALDPFIQKMLSGRRLTPEELNRFAAAVVRVMAPLGDQSPSVISLESTQAPDGKSRSGRIAYLSIGQRKFEGGQNEDVAAV